MLKEHRHLKIQRRMRIEMALNELNVCYHAEPEDASDLWTSGVVCGQVWNKPPLGTNYPRGQRSLETPRQRAIPEGRTRNDQ